MVKEVSKEQAQKVVATSIGVSKDMYLSSQDGGGSENTGYTKDETNALLDEKADVTTVDSLTTRVTTNEDNINDLTISVSAVEDTVGQLDTDIDDITEELSTKADIKVQQPSCLTLTLTGVDLPFPTDYTSVVWQENPLLVGNLMTTDLTTITFTRQGYIDLQVTGELKGNGIMDLQLLINGVVAPLSHFIKSLSSIYNTYTFTFGRIAVNVDDTLEVQVKSSTGMANTGILFIREVF